MILVRIDNAGTLTHSAMIPAKCDSRARPSGAITDGVEFATHVVKERNMSMLENTRPAKYAPIPCRCARVLACCCLTAFLLPWLGCSSQTDTAGRAREYESGTARKAVILQSAIAQEDSLSSTMGLTFDRTTYDFGQINPRSTNKATFRLRNNGHDPLHLSDVRTCCGAVVELDKRELAANESAILTVEYHAGSAASKFSKKIGVVSDDPQSPLTELTITGEVAATLAWTPAQFKIPAYDANSTCPRIAIRSLNDTPFAVRGFTATDRCLIAAFDPNHRSTEFALTPEVDMAALESIVTRRGVVRIDLDHPDYQSINLSFEVAEALEATPAQLFVFDGEIGKSILRPLEIQDNEADPVEDFPVEIESVTAEGDSRIEIRELTQIKAGCCRLVLEIWPAGGDENETFTVDQLQVKLKDGRELAVPLRIFYLSPVVSGTAGEDSRT